MDPELSYPGNESKSVETSLDAARTSACATLMTYRPMSCTTFWKRGSLRIDLNAGSDATSGIMELRRRNVFQGPIAPVSLIEARNSLRIASGAESPAIDWRSSRVSSGS